jgi:hypothetical protein
LAELARREAQKALNELNETGQYFKHTFSFVVLDQKPNKLQVNFFFDFQEPGKKGVSVSNAPAKLYDTFKDRGLLQTDKAINFKVNVADPFSMTLSQKTVQISDMPEFGLPTPRPGLAQALKLSRRANRMALAGVGMKLLSGIAAFGYAWHAMYEDSQDMQADPTKAGLRWGSLGLGRNSLIAATTALTAGGIAAVCPGGFKGMAVGIVLGTAAGFIAGKELGDLVGDYAWSRIIDPRKTKAPARA